MESFERNLLLIAVAGLLAWLALRPASPSVPVPPPVPGPPVPNGLLACPPAGTRVLLLGDSLAVGMDQPMQSLAAQCGVAFLGQAKVGTSVTQWSKESWIGPALDLARPNVVLVSLGANDFGRNDAANVQASTSSLVSRIRSYGARVFWMAPPTMPFEDKVGAEAAWKAAVGSDWFDAAVLDIPRSPDRIHPTGAGYRTMAGAFWNFMAARVSA